MQKRSSGLYHASVLHKWASLSSFAIPESNHTPKPHGTEIWRIHCKEIKVAKEHNVMDQKKVFQVSKSKTDPNGLFVSGF